MTQTTLTFLAVVYFGLALHIHAQTEEPPIPKLTPKVYSVPPGMFSMHPDKSDQWNKIKPAPGVKSLGEKGSHLSESVYDVKKFLEAQAVPFPRGSEAIYVYDGSIVFVRNTQENLDIIDALLGDTCGGMSMNLRNEISIVSLGTPKNRFGRPAPTFAELKKQAGESWREIFSMEVVSRSGLTATATSGTGKAIASKPDTENSKVKAPELPHDASGSSFAIEPIVGPDGWTIDATLSFRHQGVIGENKPLNISYDGGATLWDNYPQILQLVEATESTPAYAVILRITIALPSTWPVRETRSQDPSATTR